MTLDECIATFSTICDRFRISNNNSYYYRIGLELSSFKRSITSTVVPEVFQDELYTIFRELGYDKPINENVIIADKINIVPTIFTKERCKRYILFEQEEHLDDQLIHGDNSRLKQLFIKNSPRAIVEDYHTKCNVANPTRCEQKSFNNANEKHFHIAWMGDVTIHNVWTLTDFLDNVCDSDVNSIKISFVSNPDVDMRLFDKYQPKIMVETYTDNEIEILKNADLCVTTAEQSLLPSIMGLTTILRPNYDFRYRDNRFVYSFELDKMDHSVDHYSLAHTEGETNGIESILSDINCTERKKELGSLCKEYAKNTLLLAIRLFTHKGIASNRLLLNRDVRRNYKHYRTYNKKTNATYEEYLSTFDVKTDNLGPSESGISDTSTDKIRRDQTYGAAPQYSLEKITSIQQKYNTAIEVLKKQNGKIKVAFLVTFKETFPTLNIFKAMVDSEDFDPFIIAIPNVSKSLIYQNRLYKDTFESLKARYGDKVIGGYDPIKNEYMELREEYRMLFFNNPYDTYDHPYHNIKYFDKKNVLTLYANYAFPLFNYWNVVISLDFYSIIWKVILETESHVNYYRTKSPIKGANSLLAGYVKMDDMIKETKKDEKINIIIAPHHTVIDDPIISISNFLRYSDFFLKLPSLYPDINFIFRPHPLLFTQLVYHNIWSPAMVEEYIEKIKAIPNMTYDTSDYYFDTFANSDAIIHDCGSFIAEYLFTKKPCCYMIKSNEHITNSLLPFAREYLDNYYTALSEEDIMSFIDNVVIDKKDPMKSKRESFLEKIMVNYPDSSGFVIDYLMKTIGRK